MCLGIPAIIIEKEGKEATVAIAGLKQKVRLDFTPEANLGDYVIVHAGFAISILKEEEAEETLSLLKEADVIP